MESNVLREPVYRMGWHRFPVAEVDAVASVEGDRVFIHIVNRTFKGERNFQLSGYGLTPGHPGTLHLMSPRDQPANEPFRHFSVETKEFSLQNGMITLPPRSVACLIFPLGDSRPIQDER